MWGNIDDLNYRGAGYLGIQKDALNIVDNITYAERNAGQWFNGNQD